MSLETQTQVSSLVLMDSHHKYTLRCQGKIRFWNWHKTGPGAGHNHSPLLWSVASDVVHLGMCPAKAAIARLINDVTISMETDHLLIATLHKAYW